MAIKFATAGCSATYDTMRFNGGDSQNGNVNPSTNATADATNPNGQARALRITAPNGGGAWCMMQQQFIISDAGARISFGLQLDNYPTTTGSDFDAAIVAVGPYNWRGYWLALTSAGKLLLQDGVGHAQTLGTTVLTKNVHHWICIAHVITNATTHDIRVWLDGSLEITETNAFTVGAGSDSIAWGEQQFINTSGSATHLDFTDIIVDDSASLAILADRAGNQLRVTPKWPNDSGTVNGFVTQIGAGGSGNGSGHSPQVNERTRSDADGWSIVGSGSAVTEEYNVQGAGAGDFNVTARSIVGYGGWVRAKASASVTGTIILNGVASNIALTTAITMYDKYVTSGAVPPGAGADVGITSPADSSTVSLYEAGVEVVFGGVIGYKFQKNMLGGLNAVLSGRGHA